MVEKLNLFPPVNVERLVSERASLEYVSWTQECDAVTSLMHNPPRVFVKDDTPLLRRRFTLAHELGHLELAWHVGDIGCATGSQGADVEPPLDQINLGQERQANEFASRILMPDRWLSPLVSGRAHFRNDEMQEILDELSKAEVSALAGAIALSRHLLPGHALFVGTKFAVSKGTPWPGYPPLGPDEVDSYLDSAYEVHEFQHQGHVLRWAFTIPRVTPVEDLYETAISDPRTPHKILTECCNRAFPTDAPNRALSINGIFGGVTAKVSRGWQFDGIISVVHDRISAREDLRAVLTDHDFMIYLCKKARIIIDRRSDGSPQ